MARPNGGKSQRFAADRGLTYGCLRPLIPAAPSFTTPSAPTGGYIAHRGHWSAWSGDNRIPAATSGSSCISVRRSFTHQQTSDPPILHFAMTRAPIDSPMAVIIHTGSRLLPASFW